MQDSNNRQELKAGTVLQNGRYRIVRKLGQGGFGITYEGVQTGLERTVAIKEFFMKDYCNRDDATNCVSVGTKGSIELVENFQKKFLKEARFIAQLSDVPHIVRIYDVFEENQTAYYVMEYINGGSLKQLVARDGPLNEQQAIRYTQQLGQALQSLHQHNILHLDVKPDNVLLNTHGEAVLIDFGVSKRYDQTGSQTSTTPIGLSKGFAPIEQYKNGGMDLFSPATDVYSLGATLFFLLAGLTPPEADEILENGLPSRPNSVSPTSWKAIEQAMQPIKKNRPQSINAFLALLSNDNEKTIPTASTETYTNATIDPNATRPAAPARQAPIRWAAPAASHSKPAAAVFNDSEKGKSRRRRRWLWPVVTMAALAAIALVLVFFVFKPLQPKWPEEKVVDCMEQMVSTLKDTHIRTSSDAKELEEKMASFRNDMENLQNELNDKYSVMSDEEKEEWEKQTKDLETRVEELMKSAGDEMERLQKEAKEADVELNIL